MDMVYLDNNATTRPADPVVQRVHESLTRHWANPSSVHRLGQDTRQQLELARAQTARLIGAQPRELIFTSGGTESISLALTGTVQLMRQAAPSQTPVVLTTAIEHSAVKETVVSLTRAGAIEAEHLALHRDGRVDLPAFERALTGHAAAGRPVLVTVQWANNETGILQPVPQIGAAVNALRIAAAGQNAPTPRVVLHTDATQAVGKIPVDVASAGIDMLTFAAHKFHGPKGVGALYLRGAVRLIPQQRGGPQERDRRAGTENVPGILGMAEAARLAMELVADPARVLSLKRLRDRFESLVLASCPGAVVNGLPDPAPAEDDPFSGRLWNTTNIGFPRLEAEAVLVALSERGVCASAGSACSSGSLEPSPVLLAMGIPDEVAHGSVRFSLSRETTAEQIEHAARVVAQVIERLRKTLPV